jgi:hypothetical protein
MVYPWPTALETLRKMTTSVRVKFVYHSLGPVPCNLTSVHLTSRENDLTGRLNHQHGEAGE